MRQQKIFQINAFSSETFSGNPALVCPLQEWLDDQLMQKIAAESTLTCAFFVGHDGHYEVRWFAPTAEIEGICGHGTMASGFVILTELDDRSDEITFHVRAGDLRVCRSDSGYILDLPALHPTAQPQPDNIQAIFGRTPDALVGALDLIAVLPAEDDVASFQPDYAAMRTLPLRAVIVTAPGREVDFVSRWFAPKHGEKEDTGITGSAHCSLAPYWADRLGKTTLRARQLSPRGGLIDCELRDDRVWLRCMAVKYMQGSLYL
jgi:PhzF family phenazine biosynthesis protein